MNYDIYDYYEDGGLSAKIGTVRSTFDKMLEDGKHGMFDVIIAIMLDRILRSDYDVERINIFLMRTVLI